MNLLVADKCLVNYFKRKIHNNVGLREVTDFDTVDV